jgi:hypothetical protein
MQRLLFLRLAAVPAEGLIAFLMQDAVQLSAALQGVLWQMCETPLESTSDLYFTAQEQCACFCKAAPTSHAAKWR